MTLRRLIHRLSPHRDRGREVPNYDITVRRATQRIAVRSLDQGRQVNDHSVASSWRYSSDDRAAAPYSTRSVLFDGVDDDVRTANGAVSASDTFTLSAWVKTASAVAAGLISRTGSGRYNYIMRLTSAGRLELAFETAGSGVQTLTGSVSTLQDGRWHHCAVTFDAATLAAAVYVDGSLDASATLAEAPNDLNPRRVYLGRYSTEYLAGVLDEAAIYSSALSAAEVRQIYNGGTPGNLKNLASVSSLVSWWRMGDGDGDRYPTIADNQGSADGTMTNMTSAAIAEVAP